MWDTSGLPPDVAGNKKAPPSGWGILYALDFTIIPFPVSLDGP